MKHPLSFSNALISCKTMGVTAIFIAWALYPTHIPGGVPSLQQLQSVTGELRTISADKNGVFDLRIREARVDGLPQPRDFQWRTRIEEKTLPHFQAGSHIELLILRERPLIRVSKPFSWLIKVNGRTVMSPGRSLLMQRQDIQEHRGRALNILIFGVGLLATVLAIEFRHGRRGWAPNAAS